MTPTHYTERFGISRPGPEADLQARLEVRLHSLFDMGDELVWTGGAVPVGAGQPDIILAKCQPNILGLGSVRGASDVLLGYLRAVGYASPQTISRRIGRTDRQVAKLIDELTLAGILESQTKGVSLSEDWRDVLKDVIAIEVKVSDWRRAIHQAIRNTIVAHRSYIALPDSVAVRICEDQLARAHGIGILSISDNGCVKAIRRARKTQPKVWSYYYAVAHLASECFGRAARAVPVSG
jgi:hypothetical protein